jgi:phospholipid/cholesterol/gamma-HCH transport system substrate-binding protein
MTRTGRARNVGVGVTLMLALSILAALIMVLGDESRIFRSRNHYTTTVANSIGLKSGSPVVMGGVQIGTITEVTLKQNPDSQGILLHLSVDRSFAGRIRGGSIASVGYITLLSGEKFVNISPGQPSAPELPSGSDLPPDRSETLLETGQNVAENLAAVTGQLREILGTINNGEGLVGKLVRSENPYFGKETVDSIHGTFEKSEKILGKIEEGKGILGRVIGDDDYARDTLGSIRSAAGRIDSLLAEIDRGNGALGALIKEGGDGKRIVADLKDASASLKNITSKLEAKTGLIGRLLNDEEYSERVAQDVGSITSSLKSILSKLDRGEGTAGALINDRSVFESLQDIVTGIEHSRLAKGMVRRYGKKGAAISDQPPKKPDSPK